MNDWIRTLIRRPRVDLARDLTRDPHDAPVLDVRADVEAQDLGWEFDWADRILGP